MDQSRNFNLENHVHISFDANSMNESFARMIVAAFMSDMNPTLEEIGDVKTAVSEAVTNAIIHGYGPGEKIREENPREAGMDPFAAEWVQEEGVSDTIPQVEMICIRTGKRLEVQIIDQGVGIENIEQAMEPFYTTKGEQERSGMGFAFMEAFMDELIVESEPQKGTTVTMVKYIDGGDEQ